MDLLESLREKYPQAASSMTIGAEVGADEPDWV
jgi:hypothetical protein